MLFLDRVLPVLIIQRWQILPVLYYYWTFMGVLWIDIVVLLVSDVLVLLLRWHSRGSVASLRWLLICVLRLLLDGHVVLGGCALLLGLHHQRVLGWNSERWVYKVVVLSHVLRLVLELTCHHWGHYYILNVVVY